MTSRRNIGIYNKSRSLTLQLCQVMNTYSIRLIVYMSEANWRQCAEYEVKEVSIGMHTLFVYQMRELSLDDMFAMLSEMDSKQTEISGTRIWTGSLALSHVR